MRDPRLIAFDVLYDVQSSGSYSNLTLDKALSESSDRDKAFISALVYGVIERRLTLEYLLQPYLNGRTKPKVLLILLMGAYQLYFMDKVPSSAAVNESVKLAKNVGLSYYSSLINAVLHKVDSNRIDINSIDDLSIRYSCPQPLINMWRKAYGDDDTAAILSAINDKPPIFAIPNRRYVDAEELSYELSACGIENEVYDDVVRIISSFDLHHCRAFDDGLFYIEDISSYNCAHFLGAQPGETVIDVCAAPGGKSFTIANDMDNKGTLLSFDIHSHRALLIQKSASRLGLDIIKADVNDATVYNSDIPLADRILCDVPCSGFGIIRRKPEIRYKDLDSIKGLPDIQYSILETSSRYLKNGGTIIYSTCTLNKRENEKVVDSFLANNTQFNLIDRTTVLPTIDGGDGFFWAVMKKNND